MHLSAGINLTNQKLQAKTNFNKIFLCSKLSKKEETMKRKKKRTLDAKRMRQLKEKNLPKALETINLSNS